MSRFCRFVVPALALLLLLSAAPLFAATQNAVVYGTVYDASGNPLAGATVTLDNPALGFTRTTTTGSDGSYNFAEVPPAEGYRITALKDGNKLDIRAGIVVNVGDERVIFPPLKEQAVPKTGPKTEVVERKVEAQAVRNETVSPAVSGVITGDQLRSLPLYNRNFLALGGLTPNVHDLDAANELAGASFSVSGLRGSSNNFLLDGSDNVDSGSNQAVPFQVNDAIQEFRVTSAGATAEYGRNMGGVVNVVTRRAGNAFHGSMFGYFGNDSFNSNNPLSVYSNSGFAQSAAYAGSTAIPAGGLWTDYPLDYNTYVSSARAGGYCTDGTQLGGGGGGAGCTPVFDPAAFLASRDRFKPSFDSKQFGVNAGGALIKDKLFLFGSYEATLINNPNSIFERVPTTWDTTRIHYGVAPGFGAAESNWMLGQNVLSLYPGATDVALPGVFEFYRGEAPNWTDVHNFLVRSDLIQSERSSWSFRYALQKLNQLHDDSLPVQATYPGNGAYRNVLNQNLNMVFSHTFTPNTINEARIGFNRFNVNDTPQDASFNAQGLGFDYPSMPTIMLAGIDPELSGAAMNTMGAIGGWTDYLTTWGLNTQMAPLLDGEFPYARLGAPLGAPMHRIDTTMFLADNLSWTHGKHGFKFGLEYRHLGNSLSNGALARGLIYAGNIGEFTHDAETCNNALAGCTNNAFQRPSFDFATRQPSAYAGSFISHAVSAYFQDTFRVTSRVTLSFGLRYEAVSNPREANNQLWNFDPRANGLVQQGTSTSLDPFGQPCGTPLVMYGLPAAFGWGSPNSWSCGSGDAGLGGWSHNLGPRFGLAWDLFGDSKTVLRLGGGMYFDQQPIGSTAQLMYNRPNPYLTSAYGQLLNAGQCVSNQCALGNTMFNPTGQNVLSTDLVNNWSHYAAVDFPMGLYARDLVHKRGAYVGQFNATIQHQFTGHVAMEVGYVGSWGEDLPVVYNANFRDENIFQGPMVTGKGNNVFFPIYTLTNQASSSYNSLMARLRIADWHGLRSNVGYSWSKSLDNNSNPQFPFNPMPFNMLGWQSYLATNDMRIYCLYWSLPFCSSIPLAFPSIPFNTGAVTTTGAGIPVVSRYIGQQDPFRFLQNDWGPSDFDSRHRFVWDYTWDIPGPKGSVWLDNWQMSGIFTAQSGQPFTIFAGPIMGEVYERATATGPVAITNNPNGAISTTNLVLPMTTAACTTTWWLGITPFMPTDGNPCTGNTGRNAFTGPSYINMNFAIQKGFHVFGENRMLTLRTEFFNMFNRANYYNPISTLSTDGTNINPDFGKIKSAHDPRQIQFAVRFTF